MKDQLVVTC